MRNTLAVMDYSTSEIHLYKFDKEVQMSDEIVQSLGHDLDECYWMFGKGIDIIRHTGTYVNP